MRGGWKWDWSSTAKAGARQHSSHNASWCRVDTHPVLLYWRIELFTLLWMTFSLQVVLVPPVITLRYSIPQWRSTAQQTNGALGYNSGTFGHSPISRNVSGKHQPTHGALTLATTATAGIFILHIIPWKICLPIANCHVANGKTPAGTDQWGFTLPCWITQSVNHLIQESPKTQKQVVVSGMSGSMFGQR